MDWVDIRDRLPQVSYLESDNVDDPYEDYPVLLYSEEGVCCVGYLVMEQDENDWNYGEFSWELYVPGSGGEIVYRDLETFSKWKPLPETR